MLLKVIVIWVQLLVLIKSCNNFTKEKSMNYSNMKLKKLDIYSKVSPQNVFPLPVKDGCLSILLRADRADEYELSIRICKMIPNQNTVDADFHQKIIQKCRKEKQEQAREITLALKDLINNKDANSCSLNALALENISFRLNQGGV